MSVPVDNVFRRINIEPFFGHRITAISDSDRVCRSSVSRAPSESHFCVAFFVSKALTRTAARAVDDASSTSDDINFDITAFLTDRRMNLALDEDRLSPARTRAIPRRTRALGPRNVREPFRSRLRCSCLCRCTTEGKFSGSKGSAARSTASAGDVAYT